MRRIIAIVRGAALAARSPSSRRSTACPADRTRPPRPAGMVSTTSRHGRQRTASARRRLSSSSGPRERGRELVPMGSPARSSARHRAERVASTARGRSHQIERAAAAVSLAATRHSAARGARERPHGRSARGPCAAARPRHRGAARGTSSRRSETTSCSRRTTLAGAVRPRTARRNDARGIARASSRCAPSRAKVVGRGTGPVPWREPMSAFTPPGSRRFQSGRSRADAASAGAGPARPEDAMISPPPDGQDARSVPVGARRMVAEPSLGGGAGTRLVYVSPLKALSRRREELRAPLRGSAGTSRRDPPATAAEDRRDWSGNRPNADHDAGAVPDAPSQARRSEGTEWVRRRDPRRRRRPSAGRHLASRSRAREVAERDVQRIGRAHAEPLECRRFLSGRSAPAR